MMRRRFFNNTQRILSIIYYTSIDGGVIHPVSNAFDVSVTNNYYQDGIGYIIFNKILKLIKEVAFYGCTSLKSIEIPNSVTSIGDSAFDGCESLTSIEIPNSVTSIGNYAFYLCTSLTSIEIPNSVTSIGNGVFDGCSNLTSVIIGNSVTSIGNSAFIGCYNLTSIVVDAGNSKYDSRNGCNAIIETASNTLIAGCKNTIIPNSVTSIGDEAFYYCKSLTSIQIPNSVTSIGDDAFYGCRSLTSVYVKSTTPPSLGSTVFNDNASSRKIYVPRASLNAYKTASGWSRYADAIEPYDY